MVTLAQRIKLLERSIPRSMGNGSAAAALKRAAKYVKYRTDPPAYCRDVLKVRLTPQQERVASAVPTHKRILVPSANEVGKTHLGACLASWHYDCFDPGITLTTAPTAQAVCDLLWRELRTLRPQDRGFLPRAPRLQSSDNHFAAGYTARDASAFHGRHEASVCLIFDEAEGIDRQFWEAGESMADYWICFYNPTTTTAQTCVEESNGLWHQVNLSALDHPNIAAVLSGSPLPVPKAVTLDKVLRRLARWGTELKEHEDTKPGDVEIAGRKFRPGPVAEARVLGRRPSQAVDSVFGRALWDRVLATRHALQATWPVAIGVDVARFGDDATVIHVRQGLCSVHHESHYGWDTVVTAMRVRELAARHTGSPVRVLVDDCGVGGGVVDQLRHGGVNVTPVNGGEASEGDYPNVRSELWFAARDLAEAGMMDMSRLAKDDILRIGDQLKAPLYWLDPKGRRVVEPKSDTKDRITRSPDDADAFNLAYFVPAQPTELHG